MTTSKRSRRQFGALVGLGVVGLSGCLGDDDEEPPAEAPEDDPDEYSLDDQPADAAAMFVSPEDGATVSSPVSFEGTVEGIELAPAGDPAVGEGHLHVLVDHETFETGEVIPGPSESAEDRGIYHWGDGQSDGDIELEPGEYTVSLQIADGPHRAYGEPDEITITVE